MLGKQFIQNIERAHSAVQSGKKVYGIFGSPIAHSLSPLMHNEAFAIKKIRALYLSFDVDKARLQDAIITAKDVGISGLSITLPLKEVFIECLDDITPDAKRMGAVNTIAFKNGNLKGYNTDIYGFTAPLKEYINPIQHESVTVFGGGGAARMVLYALLQNYSFPAIYLITRNSEQGNNLLDAAETWKKHPTILERVGFHDFSRYSEIIWESRLVINCTPLGMTGYSNEFPSTFVRFFRPGQIAYDLIYTPLKTPFLFEAEKRGAITISGLDMLIGQGAQAFRIWTNKVMPQEKIKRILVEKLTGIK